MKRKESFLSFYCSFLTFHYTFLSPFTPFMNHVIDRLVKQMPISHSEPSRKSSLSVPCILYLLEHHGMGMYDLSKYGILQINENVMLVRHRYVDQLLSSLFNIENEIQKEWVVV